MWTLYDWFRGFLRTHPKWLNQWKLNNQDKNIEWPKSSEPQVNWGPFRRIPNVRNFRVTLGIKNKLLAMFGIEVKFHPTFSYEAYNNLGMNKYMNNQIYRLKNLSKTNPKLYFKIVNHLLRYSKVLFIMGLNHVEPKWHREIPLWQIYKLWKSHSKIAQLKDWEVKHHRLYIDKANGKKRPLGVPNLVWRVYLHQVSNFISLYLEEIEFFGEEQHGFRSRLGTKTAWQDILKKVSKADWVYEFDLERCFPNIHIKGVSKALRKAKIPLGWINKLEYLNMVPVDNPEDLREDTKEDNEWNKAVLKRRTAIEEQDKKEIVDWYKAMKEGSGNKQSKELTYKEVLALLSKDSPEIKWWEPRKGITLPSIFIGVDPTDVKPSEVWKTLHDKECHKELANTEADPQRGLPQGLPTSPLLTIASLEENFIKRSKWKILMYADDGIIYGNGNPPLESEIIATLNSQRYGIEINALKSRFAKLPNQEIDLKFLGMRLKGNTLSAETRNGSTMVYDKYNLIDIYDMLDNWGIVYKQGSGQDTESTMASERKPVENLEEFSNDRHFYTYHAWCEYWNRSAWEKLASSRLFGMIQSRLFQDGWNIPITQCFNLTYKPNSWVDHYKGKDLDVFNSTSVASYDLLKRLSRVRHIGRGKVAQGK